MKYKVCSYNIRVDTKNDGINCFSGRSAMVSTVLAREGLDLIGFQEVLPHVRYWLERELSGYTVIGCGREGNRDGESTPIAYRTERFYLLAFDTFWLSLEPDQPGSRFLADQSGCPRTCCAAVLVDRKTHEVLRVYNTHLDHVGERARAQGMAVVLTRITQDDARYPGSSVILMGDLNATPDSPFLREIEGLSPCGVPLRDVSALTGATFHAYHPDESSIKIDYLYTNAPCDPTETYLLTDTEDGVYLSDHYPVVALLKE